MSLPVALLQLPLRSPCPARRERLMSATGLAPTAYIPFLSAGLILARRGTDSELAELESASPDIAEFM